MRMTNFFFEDKYYAGKNVDYYIEYSARLKNQYFNLHHLNEQGDYIVDNRGIYSTVFEPDSHFPTVKPATMIIQQNEAIAEFREFYQYYYRKYLPTGMQAIALAVVLGYKEIFLTGFDLFEGMGKLHLYRDGEKFVSKYYSKEKSSSEDKEKNYQTVYKSDDYEEEVRKNHPTDIQWKFIKLLKCEYPKTHFYSVSEASPILQYVEWAPLIYDSSWYTPKNKDENAIKDWLPLPDNM